MTTSLHRDARGSFGGDRLAPLLDDVMRPGVITIAGDASVAHAQRALLAHGVHAILVLARNTHQPMGWITTRGLLRWCDRDIALAPAINAVTEPAVVLSPSASAHDALEALEREACTRVLVARRPDGLPEGVVSDVDLLRLLAR
ncbi:MAG TPA: CBS domain-containing protein [Solirubrobacteraceae bacterium]